MEGREESGGPPGGVGVVGRPSRRVGKSYRRTGRRREALLEGWEYLQEGWEAFLEAGSGQEPFSEGRDVLPEFWEGSGGPPGGPERVERPSQRAERGWESRPECQEGL